MIHSYDLNKIKQSEWYDNIRELPDIKGGNGRRDGYYNCWKAFIVKEVYEKINDDDILYYVDSSRYYRDGFSENIDKLCDIVVKHGIVAGSIGSDVRNNSFDCCNNLKMWDKILPNNDNKNF